VRRPLLVVATVIVLGSIAWWGVATLTDDGPDAATVDRGPVVIGAEVTGTLNAMESTTVGPPVVPGIWQYKLAMMAPEGETVQQGQPVLGFDPSEIREQLRDRRNDLERVQKEAEKSAVDHEVQTADDELALAEAEADLRKARLAAARPSELFSSIELEKARLDLELAGLRVENLRRRIDASRRAREAELAALMSEVHHHRNRVAVLTDAERRMVRPAPRPGLVIYVADWRQQKKKVGDTCWISDRIIEIPDLSRMMADGAIEEALSGRLHEGLPVSLRLDAHPDLTITGTVTRVVRAVQQRSWRNPEKVVRVEILIDESDPELMRPGMRFRGTVETRRIDNAVRMPRTALFAGDRGAVAYRRTLFGVEEVAVTIGARGTEYVEILDGLEPSDSVLLEKPA
jgi:HlyD family secretion protein